MSKPDWTNPTAELMKQAYDHDAWRRGLNRPMLIPTGSTINWPFIEYRGQPPVMAYLGPQPCAWCGGLPPRCCHSEKW